MVYKLPIALLACIARIVSAIWRAQKIKDELAGEWLRDVDF